MHATKRQPDWRHDNVVDQRLHDCRKRAAENEADSHVDNITLHREFFEFFHNAHFNAPYAYAPLAYRYVKSWLPVRQP